MLMFRSAVELTGVLNTTTVSKALRRSRSCVPIACIAPTAGGPTDPGESRRDGPVFHRRQGRAETRAAGGASDFTTNHWRILVSTDAGCGPKWRTANQGESR